MGASRLQKQASWIEAESSAPKPAKRVASCAIRQRPVRAHRRGERVDVERHDRAQVDHFGIEAQRLGGRDADVHHRAVGDDGDGSALARDGCLADRHLVVTLGHVALRVVAPADRGPVRVAVERPVVEALGLEEDHRIVVLDRRDQQALRVVGFDGITTLMPLTCANTASGLCECVWPPRMPPPQGVRMVTGAVKSAALR